MVLCRKYTIQDFLQRNQGQHFKGSQPLTLTKDNVNKVKRGAYSINTKTDGIRFFLYIDTNGNMHTVNKLLKKDLLKTKSTPHSNTLLDGEIVEMKGKASTKQLFIAYDIMFHKGQCLLDLNYKERFLELAKVVKSIRSSMPSNLQLQLQDTIHNADAYLHGQQLLSKPRKYKTDGLIFYPNTPYIIGVNKDTQHPLLKWKPYHENTIDFKMRVVEEKNGLFVCKLLGRNNQAYTHPQNNKDYNFMRETVFEKQYIKELTNPKLQTVHNHIIECAYQGGQYEPIQKMTSFVVKKNIFKCTGKGMSEKYNLPEYYFERVNSNKSAYTYTCVQFLHVKKPVVGSTYVCKWRSKRFVPFRPRDNDKKEPNNFLAMKDTVKNLENPVLLSEFSGKSNLFKNKKPSKANPVAYMKYVDLKNANKRTVLNLNPKRKSMKKVYKKLSSIKTLGLVNTSRNISQLQKLANASNTLSITKCNMSNGNICSLPSQFHVVLAFGNIPFASQSTFQKYIESVDKSLVTNGYFIGSMIDADLMNNKMKSLELLNQMQINGMRYTKMFNSSNNSNFNKIVGSVGSSAQKIQYIVKWKLFLNVLESAGFVLKKTMYRGIVRYFTFMKPSVKYTYDDGYKAINYEELYNLFYKNDAPNLKFAQSKPPQYKKGLRNLIKEVQANVKANKQKNAPKKTGPEQRVDAILSVFTKLSQSNFQITKKEKKRPSARNWVWDQAKIRKYETRMRKGKLQSKSPPKQTVVNMVVPNANTNALAVVNKGKVNGSPNMTGRYTKLNAINMSNEASFAFINMIRQIYFSQIDVNMENYTNKYLNGVKLKELELRIGKHMVNQKGGKSFEPGVSKQTFMKIKQYFMKRKDKYTLEESVVWDLSFNKEDVRISHKASSDEKYATFEKKWLNRKRRIKREGSIKDIVKKSKESVRDIKHTQTHAYDMRIQVSKEVGLPEILLESLTPTYIRHKTRYSFQEYGKVKVDMTIIKEGKRNTIDDAPLKYEVEIENIFNRPVHPGNVGQNEFDQYYLELDEYAQNPIPVFVDTVQTVWSLLPRNEVIGENTNVLPNNFNVAQINWNKEFIFGQREYIQKLDHDGRLEMSRVFRLINIDIPPGLVQYKYDNRNGAPAIFTMALSKWRKLLSIDRKSQNGQGKKNEANKTKHGVLKGRKQRPILAAIAYKSAIELNMTSLSVQQFVRKVDGIKLDEFTTALGIIQKYIPFKQNKTNKNNVYFNEIQKVLSVLKTNNNYTNVVAMYNRKIGELTNRVKSIFQSKKCELQKSKEAVCVAFLELGVNKELLVKILELTQTEINRALKCTKLQYIQNTSQQPVLTQNEFKRQRNYRITLRRVLTGPTANYKSKPKSKVSAAKWKKDGPLKLVDLKQALMNVFYKSPDKIQNIIYDKIFDEYKGAKQRKLQSTIDAYVGKDKKFKNYNTMLDELIVFNKINLRILYDDFVPDDEYWAFTFAGEKDESNNNGNRMKNAPIKVHSSRDKNIIMKKNAVNKMYKSFQNASELRMNFEGKDYKIKIFANGTASTSIGGDKEDNFVKRLMQRVRFFMNKHKRAVGHSERSIYYGKPIEISPKEFEDTIRNAMINANIKTTNQYATTITNKKGATNMYNMLKKYEHLLVQKTHIGLDAKHTPLGISTNGSKVIFKMKGENIPYKTDDNGGVTMLPGIISITFNMTKNGTIEISARTENDIKLADSFINSFFKKHAKELLVKVAGNKSTPKRPTPKRPTPKRPTPKRPTPKRPTPKRPTPKRPTPKRPTPKSSTNSIKSSNIKNNIINASAPMLNNANENMDGFELNNFNRVSIKGDGHCLFRAIAFGLFEMHKTNPQLQMSDEHQLRVAKKLRKIAAKELINKTAEVFNNVVLDLPNGFHENYNIPINASENVIFRRYKKELANGNLWGGEIEISLLAAYLQRPIFVYQSGWAEPRIYGDDYAEKKPIRIVRINRNHYDALVPPSIPPLDSNN